MPGQPRQSYAEASWFSYISFSWLNPLMITGERRQVALADIPELVSEEDTWSRTRELLQSLDEEERLNSSHPLLRAVVRSYWPSLLLMQTLHILQHFMSLAAPLLLKQVLVFQEAQEAHEKAHHVSAAAFGAAALSPGQVTTGISAIIGSILLGLVTMVFGSQVSFYQARLSIRMGQALRGVVVTRCVQGELPCLRSDSSESSNGVAAGKTAPSVYNVVSFDIQPNIDIIWVILAAWLFPFQFITAVAVLFREVRWAIIPGLAVILVVEAVCFVLYYYDGHFRHALLAAKDNRLGRCDEAFSNIRTLQMLSWASPFEKQILEARNEELRVKNLRLWMVKIVPAMSYVLSAAVTLVTLAYFVTYYSHGIMKASVAVPVIGLVTGLIGPFAQLPNWVNQYLVWRSAYSRVNQYMGLSKPAPSSSSGIGGIGGGPRGPPSTLDGDCWEVGAAVYQRELLAGTVVAGFKDCTLSWGQGGHETKNEGHDVRSSTIGSQRDNNEDDPTTHDFQIDDQDGDDLENGAVAAPLLGNDLGDSTLQELFLEVGEGELWAIVGQEGHGKSSMLSALLGEMPLVSGAVFSPAIGRRVTEAKGPLTLPETAAAGRELLKADAAGEGFAAAQPHAVAFAPQEPAIYTGSIQSNVLFGCRHEPTLYHNVIKACQLELDIASMPLGDSTEVSQGGSTLSGGQKARLSLARAVYKAALALKDESSTHSGTLVLLDEPFCALDRRVATDIVRNLFQRPDGLLARAAVVVTTVDPWWLPIINASANAGADVQDLDDINIAVLRRGRLAATGSMQALRQLCAEFPEVGPAFEDTGRAAGAGAGDTHGSDGEEGQTANQIYKNPQDDSDGLNSDDGNNNDGAMGKLQSAARKPLKQFQEPVKTSQVIQTLPAKNQARTINGKLLQEEHREQGHVKTATYTAYLANVGHLTLAATLVALCGIMIFQELTTLWIAYWSADSRQDHFLHPYVLTFMGTVPSGNQWLLWVYAALLAMFTISTFAGHILEIIGGIRAARQFFKDALLGTLGRPFRWWDTNPTGRVLNRFSEDVEIMDNSITNIIGVISGAVLYFVGHVFILALANKFSLVLLPIIALVFELIARYYRKTIREVHRLYLVSMSTLYQGMVEAIVGSTTVRAFGASQRVVCQSLQDLDTFMRLSFIKEVINAWVGLRMQLVGFSLSIATTLYPVLQYYGLLAPQTAGMIAFSITYSQGINGIIQQFVMNFSDLEMQLISIERLREYASSNDHSPGSTPLAAIADRSTIHSPGLQMHDVTVTYRNGLMPALANVSLTFAPGESTAIIGRTGAGKSSMLLSILQLVPYTGHIAIDGQSLSCMDPKDVRQRLVGVVPQQPVIFSGSIRWNLDPHDEMSSMDLWRALESVGLRNIVLEDGRGLEAPLGVAAGKKPLSLSQGQRQLLCAARALLRRPRVVLLDEVSACLPAAIAKTFTTSLVQRFTEQDAAVLLVTHQADVAEACDHTVTVAGGRIIAN